MNLTVSGYHFEKQKYYHADMFVADHCWHLWNTLYKSFFLYAMFLDVGGAVVKRCQGGSS